MRKEGEVKISDLSPPLHFLEQLSHPGREKVLQPWERPGIGYGLVSIYNWKLFSFSRLHCRVPFLPTESYRDSLGFSVNEIRSVMANTDQLGHNECNYEFDSANMSTRSFIDTFGDQK